MSQERQPNINAGQIKQQEIVEAKSEQKMFNKPRVYAIGMSSVTTEDITSGKWREKVRFNP